MDDLTPEQRRKSMQAIRSTDTSIEIALRTAYGIVAFGIEKITNNYPANPISLSQSTESLYFVIRIIGMVMTGRIGIRESSQTAITGYPK